MARPARAQEDPEPSGSGENENRRKLDIIRAAEYLFSRSPYEAVSIRDIAARAGVNSALIRYHFGAKDELYQALFERRYHAISSTRIRDMRTVRIEEGSIASLRAIVDAWTQPLLHLLEEPEMEDFVLLLAREAGDASRDSHGIFRKYLDPSARVCIASLRRVFPKASSDDVAQGYMWMVAVVMSTITGASRKRRLAMPGAVAAPGMAATARQLGAFVTAGFWALMEDAGEASRKPRRGA